MAIRLYFLFNEFINSRLIARLSMFLGVSEYHILCDKLLVDEELLHFSEVAHEAGVVEDGGVLLEGGQVLEEPGQLDLDPEEVPVRGQVLRLEELQAPAVLVHRVRVNVLDHHVPQPQQLEL
jgi:hypothetical protein